MADNAPNAIIPGGNIVHGFHKKVKLHVITVTGADGSAAMNQSRSTGGCTVTYIAEGRYQLGFPADTTGSIGWAQVCPPQVPGHAVTDVRMYAIDSGTVNYATGRVDITAVDGSATPAASDIIGDFTVLVYVLPA